MSVAGMGCMKADTCSSLIGSKIKGGAGCIGVRIVGVTQKFIILGLHALGCFY